MWQITLKLRLLKEGQKRQQGDHKEQQVIENHNLYLSHVGQLNLVPTGFLNRLGIETTPWDTLFRTYNYEPGIVEETPKLRSYINGSFDVLVYLETRKVYSFSPLDTLKKSLTEFDFDVNRFEKTIRMNGKLITIPCHIEFEIDGAEKIVVAMGKKVVVYEGTEDNFEFAGESDYAPSSICKYRQITSTTMPEYVICQDTVFNNYVFFNRITKQVESGRLNKSRDDRLIYQDEGYTYTLRPKEKSIVLFSNETKQKLRVLKLNFGPFEDSHQAIEVTSAVFSNSDQRFFIGVLDRSNSIFHVFEGTNVR